MSFKKVVGIGERTPTDVLIAQTTQCWAAPDVTDFGIGQPQDAILPVDILHKAASQQAAAGRRHSLQYGTEFGDGHLRLALADFLRVHYGIAVDPEPIFITNGNSQAIDMVCTAFTQPGEVVFVEEPSYFLALDIFRNHHLKIVGIPVDERGLSIDALEVALEQHAPTLIYTIPAFHNPTGVILSAERRQRLVELAVQHGFLIVADEVYQLLDYLGDAPAPMAAYLDSGRVLSLGTFSKILAPGLRLGWIQAEMSLLQQLAKTAYVASGGGLNPYTSSIVQCVIEQGWQAEYLQTLRTLFRERTDVMHDALTRHFPKDISYKKPTGGYFFWLKFAPEIDTKQFLNKARDLKVGFRAGSAFSVGGGQKNFMRLSFAFYNADRIEVGIETLARAISSS
jgi:DNA-binding transcriptional MocR family regulator